MIQSPFTKMATSLTVRDDKFHSGIEKELEFFSHQLRRLNTHKRAHAQTYQHIYTQMHKDLNQYDQRPSHNGFLRLNCAISILKNTILLPDLSKLEIASGYHEMSISKDQNLFSSSLFFIGPRSIAQSRYCQSFDINMKTNLSSQHNKKIHSKMNR